MAQPAGRIKRLTCPETAGSFQQSAQRQLNAISGTSGAEAQIAELEAKRNEQDDIFEKATDQISDIDERTPFNALLAILKTGNVGVALLFSAVCFALFKLFITHENIAYAIAPHEIVDWIFKTLFGQPPTAPPPCKP